MNLGAFLDVLSECPLGVDRENFPTLYSQVSKCMVDVCLGILKETYGTGGFGDRSTLSIVKMSDDGSLQKRRGLSPGTGNTSSAGDNIGDWSDPRRMERPVTVMGVRRRAMRVTEVEMSCMIADAFGLTLATRCQADFGFDGEIVVK